jgi:magnesium transporter
VSVVAARLYRSGKNIKAVSLDEPIDCKGKSEFVWIGLFEPSERELEQLQLISVRAASGAKRSFAQRGYD